MLLRQFGLKKITFDYVHDCYKVETYRRIYENLVLPMNGPQIWLKSSKLPPLPPKITQVKKKGRKPKSRKKEEDEVGANRTKIKRKQDSLNCSTGHKPGNNKRTCSYYTVTPETTSVFRQKRHVMSIFMLELILYLLLFFKLEENEIKWNKNKWEISK